MKLSILLSLVNPKLNVLAIGSDTISLNRLFSYSLKHFSNKSQTCIENNCSLNELFYSKRIDTNGLNFLQAGSLMLSNDGVCYIGNILNYNKKQLTTLTETLESGKIKTEPFKNQFRKTDEKYFHFNLTDFKCNIWSYYDLTFNELSKPKNDTSLIPCPLIE